MRANTNKLNFYVSDAVRKKLERLSKNSGLTMTAVITKLILECEIHPLKTDELLKIYTELNELRKEIRLCKAIFKDSYKIAEKKRQALALQKQADKELRENEHKRRSR